MAKEFFTERDIEDMVKRGERTLVVGENVVMTDLAYEAARKLNVELVQPHDKPPGAPERPYINQPTKKTAAPQGLQTSDRLSAIKARVRNAVKSQLGSLVDDALLERVMDRVFIELGMR